MVKYRYMGLDVESTYGDAVNTYAFFDIVDGDHNIDHQRLKKKGVTGHGKSASRYGPLKATGAVSGIADCEALGYLLYGVLGGIVTPVSASGVYEHVFHDDDTLPSFTTEYGLDAQSGGDAIMFPGTVFHTLSLDFDKGDFVKFSSDWFASKPGIQTVDTPTLEHIKDRALVVYHDGSLLLDGSAVDIASISMKITRDVNEEAYFLGSRYVGERVGDNQVPSCWGIEVTGSMDLVFDSDTDIDEFQRMLGGTTSAVVPVDYKSDVGSWGDHYVELQLDMHTEIEVTTAAKAEEYTLWVYLPKVTLDSESQTISGDEEALTMTIEFEAYTYIRNVDETLSDEPAPDATPYYIQTVSPTADPSSYTILVGLVSSEDDYTT